MQFAGSRETFGRGSIDPQQVFNVCTYTWHTNGNFVCIGFVNNVVSAWLKGLALSRSEGLSHNRCCFHCECIRKILLIDLDY